MERGGRRPPLPSGQLAQLVQSAALTGRRSLVRAQYCSQKKDNPIRLSFFISPNVRDERSYKIVSSASTTRRRIASTCLRSFPTYLSR